MLGLWCLAFIEPTGLLVELAGDEHTSSLCVLPLPELQWRDGRGAAHSAAGQDHHLCPSPEEQHHRPGVPGEQSVSRCFFSPPRQAAVKQPCNIQISFKALEYILFHDLFATFRKNMNTLFWLPSLHCKGYNTWVLLLLTEENAVEPFSEILLHEFGIKPSHFKKTEAIDSYWLITAQ